MITNDQLDIFGRFKKDYDLPKYNEPDESDGMDAGQMVNMYMRSKSPIRISTGDWTNGITVSEDQTGMPVLALSRRVKTFWQRLFMWVLRKREPKPTMTILEFFTMVKDSVGTLELIESRAKGYETALANAKKLGQKALVESLTLNLVAVRAETHLIDMMLPKYVTEATLVEFVKKCPKGLRLDWIANFTRVIPSELITRKMACDSRFIFDNYVVLHYDPSGKSWAETEQEKEARRDPILFGLIEGRRQLYYVGDWVDEVCDLTLDQIADLLGARSVQELTS